MVTHADICQKHLQTCFEEPYCRDGLQRIFTDNIVKKNMSPQQKNKIKYTRNKVPLAPHCPYFVLSNFRVFVSLVDVKGYLVVALVCIFVTISEVKHPLKYLQAFMFLFTEFFSNVLPIFLLGLFIFFLLICRSIHLYLYSVD